MRSTGQSQDSNPSGAVTATAMRHVHYPALDRLRGVAVLAVMVSHTVAVTDLPKVLGHVVGMGWVGVDLFFVLSGFLITGILFDARGGRGFFSNFYARRSLRIWPLYYGFLVLIAVVLPAVAGAFFDDFRPAPGGVVPLFLYYYNFWAAAKSAGVPDGMHYVQHFWSLAVEEHFYLVWPVVVYGLGRRPLMAVCVAGAAASLACRLAVVGMGGHPQVAYLMTPCRLDGLLLGALAALAMRDGCDWRRARRWAPWAVGVGVVGMGLAMRLGANFTYGPACLAVAFAGLLVVIVERRGRVANDPVLGSVGKYSYGMYVFHPLLIGVLVKLGTPGNFLVFNVVMIAATYGAAAISFTCYESWFLRLKSRFQGRGRAAGERPVATEVATTL